MRSRALTWLVTLALPASAIIAATAATPATAAVRASSPHNGLSDVWCASTSRCVAVGLGDLSNDNPVAGHPLAQTWDGKHWKAVAVRLPAGAASGGLTGLSCVSMTSCVAVGYWGAGFTGHDLAESWNGKTWTPSKPPAPASEQTDLAEVSCPAAKSCFAVGDYEPDAATGLPVADIERWNGTRWTELKPPLPGGSDFSALASVSCPSSKSCVAVGYAFVNAVGVPLVEVWNGIGWRRVSAPSLAGGFESIFSGVSCLSAASCVAVGEKVTATAMTGFAESWNGRTWRLNSVPWPKGTANQALLQLTCKKVNSCVAVGATGMNTNLGVDNSGRAAAATWNGKTWKVVPVPAPARGKSSMFSGVSCPLAAGCVAVGKVGPTGSTVGTGLSGRWNGKSWQLVNAI